MSISKFISLIISIYICKLAACTDFEYKSGQCRIENSRPNSSYYNNVNLLMDHLITNSSRYVYYYSTYGKGLDMVHGYYLCRGDVSLDVCNSCLQNGTEFGICSEYIEGSFYSDKCMFHYSNRSTFSLPEQDIVYLNYAGDNVTYSAEFNRTLSNTLVSLIEEVSLSEITAFATKEVNITGGEKLYTLAQCTPDIAGGNCSTCLERLLSSALNSEEYQGLMLFQPKCQIMYYNMSFYDPNMKPNYTSIDLGKLRPVDDVGGNTPAPAPAPRK